MASPSYDTGVAGAKEQAAIQEFGARLNALREEFSMNLDRMERIAGRAFGQSPETSANASSPKPVPNGEIASVRERLDDIDRICTMQKSVINRLDSIV